MPLKSLRNIIVYSNNHCKQCARAMWTLNTVLQCNRSKVWISHSGSRCLLSFSFLGTGTGKPTHPNLPDWQEEPEILGKQNTKLSVCFPREQSDWIPETYCLVQPLSKLWPRGIWNTFSVLSQTLFCPKTQSWWRQSITTFLMSQLLTEAGSWMTKWRSGTCYTAHISGCL